MQCSARLPVLVLAVLFVPAGASAQSAPPAAQRKSEVGFHGWELEGHIGAIGGSTPTGTGVLPPPGQAFTTAAGAASRFVPSWYFGDGALFANQVAASITANSINGRVFPTITPLDPVLTSAGATMQSGGMLGFRAGHSITHWVFAEFMFDQRNRSPLITDAALAQIEASRASFKTYFNEVTTTAGQLYTDPHSSSTATVVNSSNIKEYSAGVAFNVTPVTIAGFIPYVSFGGELVLPFGDGPGFQMTGNYGFTQQNAQLGKIDETDTVFVRYKFEALPTGMVGFGVQRYIGRHGGFRADVHIEPKATELTTRIDTQPTGVFAGPAQKNTGTADAAIQFSTVQNRPSSLAILGQNPVNHFDSLVAKASATSFTVGYFLHF